MQRWSALYHPHLCEPFFVVLQPAQRVDERALTGAGGATHGKMKVALAVASCRLGSGEFFGVWPGDWLDTVVELVEYTFSLPFELFSFADGFGGCGFHGFGQLESFHFVLEGVLRLLVRLLGFSLRASSAFWRASSASLRGASSFRCAS